MSLRERAKAKRVISQIVKEAGGEFVGKTRLFKAFYIAHLLYAEREAGYLTTWPIVRMPHGPGIDAGDELLRELQLRGVLQCDQVPEGPWSTNRYVLRERALPGEKLSTAEKRAVRDAVRFVQSKTAAELSELTHEHSRSWIAARDGQPLNIYIDMIPDEEFVQRDKELELLHRELIAAWK